MRDGAIPSIFSTDFFFIRIDLLPCYLTKEPVMSSFDVARERLPAERLDLIFR